MRSMFNDVASEEHVDLLPSLLDGISTSQSLLQRDGIHPKPEAQPIIVDQIWDELVSLLNSVGSKQVEL